MGPNRFTLFNDVLETLHRFQKRGLQLGVISDWPKGLGQFCEELVIGALLDAVIASGEVGFQKPDPTLFEVARRQLSVPASQILHVGDSSLDVEGAHAAGFRAVLLDRHEESVKTEVASPACVNCPLSSDLRGRQTLPKTAK